MIRLNQNQLHAIYDELGSAQDEDLFEMTVRPDQYDWRTLEVRAWKWGVPGVGLSFCVDQNGTIYNRWAYGDGELT